jgi:hypothetical protein
MEPMTTPPDTTPLPVTLTLNELGELARFTGYVRMEPADGGAEGFGVEGATLIVCTLSRDAWEGLGSPVVIPVTLRNVR